MATSPESTRRWTRVEYDRLIDLGIFQPGEHLELLGGHLIVSEPQGTFHSAAVGLVEEGEPEPDVAVVPGTHRDYAAAHPARPALLVEVAESSLAADRGTKATLSARAGVADYWILNLVDRVLEVCRDPVTTESGGRYREIAIVHPGTSIAPLARPDAPVALDALLPPRGASLR